MSDSKRSKPNLFTAPISSAKEIRLNLVHRLENALDEYKQSLDSKNPLDAVIMEINPTEQEILETIAEKKRIFSFIATGHTLQDTQGKKWDVPSNLLDKEVVVVRKNELNILVQFIKDELSNPNNSPKL